MCRKIIGNTVVTSLNPLKIAEKAKITEAVNNAIKQAKENGELGGKDGTSATHSWNGTTLTITSASGTSSADLKGAKGDKGDSYVLTEADKKEIAGMVDVEGGAGGGGVSSWNDLTDKPFYDGSATFFEWDGDTTGMESVEVTFDGESMPFFYKYSDDVYTLEQLLGSTMVMSDSYAGDVEVILREANTFISEGAIQVNYGSVIIVPQNLSIEVEDGTGVFVNFTKGTWVLNPFLAGNYAKSISKTELKTLDIKFIPNELYTKIDERIDAYIEEALGGDY